MRAGGTGTLNAPVDVTFASGVGTATEYYGDEAARQPDGHRPERLQQLGLGAGDGDGQDDE